MKIKINGKEYLTNCSKLTDLKNSFYSTDKNIISIINGFQTEENVSVKDDDEIFFIDKHKYPEKNELEEMLCSRHTPNVHQKIKNARVAVAGLGGLGSNIAVMLARTGIGTLHLVDFDTVDVSNLNRQHYFIPHLGIKKTDAIKQQIAQINPFVKVICDSVKVDKKNCAEIFKDDGIVCEAFDRPEAKALLVNCLLESRNDVYVIAASGMAGFDKSNSITTKIVSEKFYICGDGTSEAKQGCGLMAPRAGICASHQANAVLRIILNKFEV